MKTTIVSTLDPDQAYKMMMELKKDAEKIAEAVKHHFKYSPFDYVDSTIGYKISEIRASLIKHFAEKYRKEYTPNYEPNENFTKLMNESQGRDDFNSLVIKQWFEKKASGTKQLRADSLAQIMDKSRCFLPWSVWDSKPLTVKDLVKGELLELNIHTWNKRDRWRTGYISTNYRGEYEALQRLIDVATRRADPSINGRSTWLTDHIKNTDPEKFYGKHEIKHKIIKAFQFFKNGKFKIWFNQARHAKVVARRLIKARARA